MHSLFLRSSYRSYSLFLVSWFLIGLAFLVSGSVSADEFEGSALVETLNHTTDNRPSDTSFVFDQSINALIQQSYTEPSAYCPAGYSQIGGVYQDKAKGDINKTYSVVAPAEGEMMVTGWAMEGHPELGCTPGGNTPNEPHPYCSQRQTQESFDIYFTESDASTANQIGTYSDKENLSKENYWFPAGQFSTSVDEGYYQLEIRHAYENYNSVVFKLVTCYRPTTYVTPTPSPSPTAVPVTPTPSPTVYASPTPSPTAYMSPTPTPSPTASMTPTPSPTTFVSPTPTPSPTASMTPTPSPTPIQSDMAIEINITKPTNSPAKVELSDTIRLETSVKNKGYSPSKNMQVLVTYPTGLEVLPAGIVSHNGWSCGISFVGSIDTSVECTKYTIPADSGYWEKVVTIDGRVPGTYQDLELAGYGVVDNENFDPNYFNNDDEYSIEVIKKWVGGELPNPELFLHAQYSDSIQDLTTDVADFEANELMVSPFQVDVDMTVGLSVDGTPYLTTSFCSNNPDTAGCDQDSDIIWGTVLQKTNILSAVVPINLETGDLLGSNLITSPITIDLGLDTNGRFADLISSSCLNWQALMGGQSNCVTRLNDYDSGWTTSEIGEYQWTKQELVRIILHSKGGRVLSCPAAGDIGACIRFSDSKPGDFMYQGYVEYQYVFHDPLNRIPDSIYIVDQEVAYTFYFRLVAPFVNRD
ncbi:MAG: hypothetical protein AB8G95_00165 [Anaerolineae bacterium]